MILNTLSSYVLALVLLLATIITVSWGVQRIVVNLTESVAVKSTKVRVGL